MPLVIVTAEHPSETDLLDLAAGRESGEATAAAKRHVDTGCRLCTRRLGELRNLVSAVKEEHAFDAILESEIEIAPELPRPAMGRTLPFVNAKARTSVEDIYQLSQTAEKPAELIVDAARAGADELAAALRALDGKPYRGFALLYAAQKAFSLVPEDPIRARLAADLLLAESATLAPASLDSRASAPAPRQAVQAEATLLKAYTFLQASEPLLAREAIAPAREFFRESGDLGFGAALCDYYEGQSASYSRDYSCAERLLKRALATFSEFGQDHLRARAEVALGTLLLHRGQNDRALKYLERASECFDPEQDAQYLVPTLNNRAQCLMRLERFDEARAALARSLNLCRRFGFQSNLLFVRNGLAELDVHRGQFRRALLAFSQIVKEVVSPLDIAFARLYIAECHARLGSYGPMTAEIEALRGERQANRFAPSPAFGELFVCLDQGMLDGDLIAHVREYLQGEENGEKRAYRPLRLVG
ncbi:MAG: tetratricopeptide repeat protein [Acidobacteriota bacterium]